MSYSYTMTQDTVQVVVDGAPYMLKKGDPNFEAIRRALWEKDWDEVKSLACPGITIQKWSRGAFKFTDNDLYYEGDPIPPALHKRIFQTAREGKDPTSLMNFWERLRKNPSKRSVDQLFSFLEHAHIPIAPNGCFLAYKGVNSNFTDKHSGTFVNTPGSVLKMARNLVSDDPRVPCHEGFHVGDLSYAGSFAGSGKVVICMVDPAHVVSVPYDESNRKVRVCGYKVVGVHGGKGFELPSTAIDNDDLPDLGEEEEGKDIYGDGTTGKKDPVNEDEDDVELEDPEEEEEPAPAPTEPVETPAVAAPMPKYAGKEALEGMNLEQVRQYAKSIGIKNVKAVLGGKPALIAKILEVERKPGQLQVSAPAAPKGTKTLEELKALNIDDLRKYASSVLKIPRAYKIPGGKEALLDACKAQLDGEE